MSEISPLLDLLIVNWVEEIKRTVQLTGKCDKMWHRKWDSKERKKNNGKIGEILPDIIKQIELSFIEKMYIKTERHRYIYHSNVFLVTLSIARMTSYTLNGLRTCWRRQTENINKTDGLMDRQKSRSVQKSIILIC